jgi:hypothetical protein
MTTALIAVPALEWNRREARAEILPDQDQVKLEFSVTNREKSVLRLDRIETSAGNITTRIDRRIMYPGDSSHITAIFNKGKRTGKHHETLEVYVEGQTESVAKLHLFVQIPELIQTDPKIIYWLPDSPKQSQAVAVDLDKRFIERIEAIEYDPTLLSIEKVPDPKQIHDFILNVIPLKFSLSLRDSIVLRAITTDGYMVESRIKVLLRPR